jgi:hypothetical protein
MLVEGRGGGCLRHGVSYNPQGAALQVGEQLAGPDQQDVPSPLVAPLSRPSQPGLQILLHLCRALRRMIVVEPVCPHHSPYLDDKFRPCVDRKSPSTF